MQLAQLFLSMLHPLSHVFETVHSPPWQLYNLPFSHFEPPGRHSAHFVLLSLHPSSQASALDIHVLFIHSYILPLSHFVLPWMQTTQSAFFVLHPNSHILETAHSPLTQLNNLPLSHFVAPVAHAAQSVLLSLHPNLQTSVVGIHSPPMHTCMRLFSHFVAFLGHVRQSVLVALHPYSH